MKPTVLYTLWHFKICKGVRGDPEDDSTAPKEIGNYTGEDGAFAAIERMKGRQGFRDWPDGFRILHDYLDHAGWPDGITSAEKDVTYWSYRRALK